MYHNAVQTELAFESSHNSNPNDEGWGITEIVLPNEQGFAMMLPMLAYLSQQAEDRWLTWLPPSPVNKAQLQAFGFDLSKVRIIHPSRYSEPYFLLWEALSQGNSSTVVASPGLLSEKEFSRLEAAAKIGSCRGLLIRSR